MLICLTAFQWVLVDEFTLFLYMPVIGLAWLGFFIVSIFSLLELKKYKAIGRQSLVPSLIQASAFLVVFYVPFTALGINLDFKLHKVQREEVVERVNSGNLTPNVEHNSSLIKLGNLYPALSAGGNEIVVEEHDGLKYLFFFTFRGILDSYAGFLYVPRGGKPTEYSDLGESCCVEIEHLDGNWYFASHH